MPNPVNNQMIGRCSPRGITHRVRLQIARTGHSNQNETVSELGNICTYNSKWDKDIRSFAHCGEDLGQITATCVSLTLEDLKRVKSCKLDVSVRTKAKKNSNTQLNARGYDDWLTV